jgi:hypothetical protein
MIQAIVMGHSTVGLKTIVVRVSVPSDPVYSTCVFNWW